MISLKNKIILAPMAGVTDRAFREICMENGADMCFTEMVSTKGLFYNDKKTAKLLEVSDNEQPVFAQIFGHEPGIFADVAPKAASYGAIGIDINCGCPAGKIISNNDGGSLMKNPSLVYDVVCAVRENCNLPVSIKIRSGWDEDSLNCTEVAKAAEKAGACHITIHGRNVKQGYSGNSNNSYIKNIVNSVNIPVIGNGDIFTPHDAVRMFEETGCEAIMLGRGTLGNPFLFDDIKSYINEGRINSQPTVEDKVNMALLHIKRIVKYKGENIGIKEARKHAIWYIKGIKGSVKVKNSLTAAKTYVEMKNLLTSLIDI